MTIEKENKFGEKSFKSGKTEVKIEKGQSLYAGGWPSQLLDEWMNDCRNNYKDCRWVKMYTDHLRSREFVSFKELYLDKLLSLEKRLSELEAAIDEAAKSTEKEQFGEQITFRPLGQKKEKR